VTKLPKPLMERVALGDSASHAGRTRSNTEQAPKQLMQEPTRPTVGEGRSRWKGTSESISSVTAGVVVTACRQRGPNETREASAVIVAHDQPATRESQAGPNEVAGGR